LGTPKVVTDWNGSVAWEAVMEPFGKINSTLVSWFDQPFRFPGQYEDELTGMYYNHHRYYVAGLGQYNSIDRSGVSKFGRIEYYLGYNNAFNVNSLKIALFSLNGEIYPYSYLYSMNNPINAFDPNADTSFSWPKKDIDASFCETRPDCKCNSGWAYVCKMRLCMKFSIFWMARKYGCEEVYWSWCKGDPEVFGIPT
jgi:RHS repeat-associated protein